MLYSSINAKKINNPAVSSPFSRQLPFSPPPRKGRGPGGRELIEGNVVISRQGIVDLCPSIPLEGPSRRARRPQGKNKKKKNKKTILQEFLFFFFLSFSFSSFFII
jgi:hypothetical protein